jgi:hypothetical protein
MEKTLPIHLSEQKASSEKEVREKIASQLLYEMMPICVCPDCGNELEGRLIKQAVGIVLGDYTINE